MIQAEVTTELVAPIETVWKAMLDFAAYRNWNPFIVDVIAPSRPLEVGDDFTLHVAWAEGKKITSGERATRIEAPKEGSAVLAYRFTGWMHALHFVRAERIQSLEQKPGGPTVYTSRETFTGFGARYVPLAQVQEGFERHAQALKRYVESAH